MLCVNSKARLDQVIKMTVMFVELLERKIEALNGSVEDERGAGRILNGVERNSDRIRGGRKAL